VAGVKLPSLPHMLQAGRGRFQIEVRNLAYLRRYFVEFLVISTLGYLTLPSWVNGALTAGGLPGLCPGPAGGLSCRACRRPLMDAAVLRLR
jgi:hypothetical protein